MKGARDYYRLIKNAVGAGIGELTVTKKCTHGGDSVAYQWNNVVFVTSTHARGYTFRIYLVNDNDETLEVYGIVRGQHGWTEEYGWIRKGTWTKPILAYLRQLERDCNAHDERLAEEERVKRAEHNRQFGDVVNRFNDQFREVSV